MYNLSLSNAVLIPVKGTSFQVPAWTKEAVETFFETGKRPKQGVPKVQYVRTDIKKISVSVTGHPSVEGRIFI